MKLSTKGRYGVRLMLEIALRKDDTPVTLNDIAKQQEISKKYLWSLINPLQKAGLVKGLRGSHGGYILAKPPAQISLRDIVVKLEGPLSIVDCVSMPSICHRSSQCVSRDVWVDISDKIEKTLATITLDDIIKKHKNKAKTLQVVKQLCDR